ncbi:MAG: aldo/keto reductase [Verrucomicrobiota bacterium]
MKYRALGNSGIQASVVGFGTWVMGGGEVWGTDADDRESIRTLQMAMDNGVNLIDTAPAYGWGRSEQVVGKAIQGRRDKAVIATKCGLWWEDDRGSFFAPFYGKTLRRSLRPDTLQLEIERSLKNLGTDHIDLYQIHWPSVPPDFTPVADTMACLLKLKQQGKIRAIGVCNVSLTELKEYQVCGEIASDQLRYSMVWRDAEKDVLPYCAQHTVATLTYMSLEQGLLTGKVTMATKFNETDFRNNEFWNPWYTPVNRQRLLVLLAGWSDLLKKYQCTLAQLVVAWTAAQPGITHVLCGMRNEKQLKDNVQAGGLLLDVADVQRIRNGVAALGEPKR